MNRRFVIAGVVGTLGVGASAIALAQDGQSPQQPRPHQQRLAPTSAVDPELSASFGVLRRDQRAGDSSPALTAVVGDSVAGYSGANPALTRLALTRKGEALYVIPGVNSVCSALAGAEGIDIGCSEPARARAGYRMAVMATERGTKLYGLAPDGVRSVTVQRAEGGPVTTDVVENGYIVEVTGAPTSLSYDGPDGKVAITVPDIAALSAQP
jgi:hypothetical protein